MQVESCFERTTLFTTSDGSENTYTSRPTRAALGAKTVLGFLDVHGVDSETALTVAVEHSADGESWTEKTSSLVSTGGAASVGLYEGHTSDFGARVRFKVKIAESSAQSNQLSANISFKAVWKPF